MTAEVLHLSDSPLSNRGLSQTLHLWVVPRAEAIVRSVLITCLSDIFLTVGEKSSVGEPCCLLVVIICTALFARPYDWREWDRGSPIVTDGGTNFRKKRVFLNDRRPEPSTFTNYWS